MPDGKTHQKLHDLFYPLPIVTAGLIGNYLWPLDKVEIVFLLAVQVGYYAGNYLDPDLDMPARTRAELKWKNTVFSIPVMLWWRMYAALATMLGGHRSFLTHFPFVSTGIRMAWFLFPVILVAYFLGVTTWIPSGLGLAILLGVFLGLSESDAVHTFFDYVL